MKCIPSEILYQIFDLLPQEDHMECMLVCHLWKEIIEDHSLFRDLRIYSTDSLKSFIKKLQDNPDIGRNVKQLTCHFEDYREVNLTKLLEPLCNLRTFNCYPEFKDDGINFSWRTSIETISQLAFSPVIMPTLATNIFPRLTVLDVDDSRNNGLLHCLKNAPALRSLTLYAGIFSFGRLETLHESLPNLNILTLEYISIFDDTFYEYTAPAKSITKIDFDCIGTDVIDTSSIQQRIDILRYIKIKYPNLMQLRFDPDFFRNYNKETDQLNDQGWRPLLQHLGSQLNELQLCYELEVQSFLDILDASRCQIQTLYLRAVSPRAAFPNIEQSQQALYLKTLVLKEIRLESFDWLKELKVLESLDIRIHASDKPLRFKFNDIVENCPDSLLSLSLINVKLAAELNSVIQCNIKTLKLAFCNLPQKIDWFISRHFPLLSAFTLSNCEFRSKTFDMKAIDLKAFYLIHYGFKDTITVLVKTYRDFEERWYSTRGVKSYHQFMYQDPTKYPPVISLPASEIKEKPFFTLYCHTMRQIVLCR